MAGLELTRGDESRLEGAPYQDLPGYADYVDAVAAKLLAEDADGLFANDRELAREQAKMMVNAELDAQRQRRAQADAAVTAAYAERQKERAKARGVDPETMPYTATASDVQRANMPPEALKDLFLREQDTADIIARGLREGKPTFEAEGDLAFLRERNASREGMAMRQAIRERRGQYYEMPDGTRIPVGREPTAADMREEEAWHDWRDETPGSDRQAKYNPAGYEEFREGVRQEIRNRAREQLATYGDGLADPTKKQLDARDDRKASEERVRKAQRGRFYQDKLMIDAGVATPRPGPDAGIEELERAAFRNRYARRQAELESRKQARIDQAMMAGGQPTGGPLGTRATTTAINQLGPGWREIALLDRLTQGRVGGPTPLGVEQFQAQAIAQGVGRALTGALANINPQAAEVMSRQRDMALRQKAGAAKHAAWDGSEKTDAVKALEKEGATGAEINAIMTDLFGPNWSEDMIDARPEKAEAVREAAAGVMEALPPGV